MITPAAAMTGARSRGAEAGMPAPSGGTSRSKRASPTSQALARILFERAPNHLRDGMRRGRRDARPVRLFADHRDDRVGDVLAVEGLLAGQHFVQHAPERPDVSAFVHGLALGLLRRHVGRGPEDHAAHGHRGGRDGRRIRNRFLIAGC
jgi:hypothetical protein